MKRKTLIAAAGVLALVATVACFDRTENNNIITVPVVPVVPAPTPTVSPSPSPSPGAGGLVASVGIGAFGETCPTGKTPAGAPNDRQARVGCVVALTCSPHDRDGDELFENIPSAPEEFRALTGEGLVVQTSAAGNPYNRDVTILAAGDAQFECKVAGVSSTATRGPYILTGIP